MPRTVETVVLSTQHSPDVSTEQLRAEVEELVIRPVLDTRRARPSPSVELLINPTGRFEIGGPQGDAGLTGRKIIVDTYGGASPPRRRRVQRQGPVEGRPLGRVRDALGREERRRGRARRPARGAGRLRDRQGRARSASTSRPSAPAHVPDERIIDAIREVFDLRPAAIIRDLDLLRPIYAQTATYGHFGRELPDFTWERLDRVDDLRAAAGL